MTSVLRFPIDGGIFGVGRLATKLKATFSLCGVFLLGAILMFWLTRTLENMEEAALWGYREVGVFNSENWERWIALNANNLVWIALVVAGILFTSLLV